MATKVTLLNVTDPSGLLPHRQYLWGWTRGDGTVGWMVLASGTDNPKALTSNGPGGPMLTQPVWARDVVYLLPESELEVHLPRHPVETVIPPRPDPPALTTPLQENGP